MMITKQRDGLYSLIMNYSELIEIERGLCIAGHEGQELDDEINQALLEQIKELWEDKE
jgi:hypothetical protein